jgi:Spy/CpxP family protein refolding chaperone
MVMTMLATANEPAASGAPVAPAASEVKAKRPEAIRENRGGMMGAGMGMAGDMSMLTSPMATKMLEITETQKVQIAAIVASTSNEISALRIKRQELTKKMVELWGADTLDEEAILKMSDQVEGTRSEMAKVQIKQMLAARKILTPEQRQKMREMMTRRMDRRGENRPESKMKHLRKSADEDVVKGDVAPVSPAPDATK